MIYVDVNHHDLEYVRMQLKWKQQDAPKALRDAVNDTATHARKLLVEAAQRRYTVKKSGFYSNAKIKKATLGNLTAEIRVQGRPLTLPRFHTTAPKSGVKAEVIRGGGLKVIVGTRQIKAFRRSRLIYQRKGKARKPLKVLYGPSIPKMMEKVYEGHRASAGLKAEIEKNYQKNLRRQIERFLNS